MTTAWISTALETWKRETVKMNAGATSDAITHVEEKTGFVFPQDFKALYQAMDGFIDWDCTGNMISIWPLERIIEEYMEDHNETFVGFCDYLIRAHSIGFVRGRPGIFKDYGNDKFIFIAASFTEAIHLIIADADIIY